MHRAAPHWPPTGEGEAEGLCHFQQGRSGCLHPPQGHPVPRPGPRPQEGLARGCLEDSGTQHGGVPPRGRLRPRGQSRRTPHIVLPEPPDVAALGALQHWRPRPRSHSGLLRRAAAPEPRTPTGALGVGLGGCTPARPSFPPLGAAGAPSSRASRRIRPAEPPWPGLVLRHQGGQRHDPAPAVSRWASRLTPKSPRGCTAGDRGLPGTPGVWGRVLDRSLSSHSR